MNKKIIPLHQHTDQKIISNSVCAENKKIYISTQLRRLIILLKVNFKLKIKNVVTIATFFIAICL